MHTELLHHTALESESKSMACFLSKLLGTRAALPVAAAELAGAAAEALAGATESECCQLERGSACGSKESEDEGWGIE